MRHKKSPYQTGLQILEASVGIHSNARGLLPKWPFKNEVPSLLTDFRAVVEIPYSSKLDGRIVIENAPCAAPTFRRTNRTALFRGPFLELERRASDPRYGLWGNQGFLYRFVLYLLENRHRLYSLHACGLYEEKKNVLYVIAGGAGSGKTVYLLSGIAKGLKLFSSETVHFRIEGKTIVWFKGSLIDNVRLGTLVHDFPQFLPRLDRRQNPADVWQKKLALDLSSHQSTQDTLVQPQVMIFFPRIEEGRRDFQSVPLEDERPAAKAVFDNLSQKISETIVLYDRLSVCGLDDEALAAARLKSAYQLVENRAVMRMASVLSGPADCWGHLLD